MARQTTFRWLALGLGILALAAGGIYWFLSGDAPAEVNLDETAAAVASSSSVSHDGIEGSWTVDTSLGDFTVESTTTATFAGFRVNEVLSSIGDTTAVGRTPEVSGSITVVGTTLTAAEIVADLTAIVSDESRREDKIQQALNTGTHPEAAFVLVEPIELGEGAESGETVSATAIGDLTINGTTQRIEMDLRARLVDGAILVTGSSDIAFGDYGVTAPSAPIVVSVDDHGTLEVQLWLTR